MGLRLNCLRTLGSRLTERKPLHMVAMMKARKLTNETRVLLNTVLTNQSRVLPEPDCGDTEDLDDGQLVLLLVPRVVTVVF